MQLSNQAENQTKTQSNLQAIIPRSGWVDFYYQNTKEWEEWRIDERRIYRLCGDG
jgi:hypothetical protein